VRRIDADRTTLSVVPGVALPDVLDHGLLRPAIKVKSSFSKVLWARNRIIHRVMTDRRITGTQPHPYSQCPPMFDAPLWRDYFVMVGGGAAALTGLVFVAMSLHLSDIASDPAHRHRARTILTALTTVFIRCGLVLMGGQTARAVGGEPTREPWPSRVRTPRRSALRDP
jgi:hypothetical protein